MKKVIPLKILGINISHNMSYCVIENGKIKSFLNEERLNKQKHFCPTLKTFNNIKGLDLFKNIEFDVVALTSWINKSEEELSKLILDKLKYRRYTFDRKNHHKYHAIAALHHSSLNEAMVLIRDGGGAPYSTEYFNYRETDTIWKVDKNKIDFVYGHYSDARTRLAEARLDQAARSWFGLAAKTVKTESTNKEINKDNSLLTSRVVGGLKYAHFSWKAGFGTEYGHFMGLAPYAQVSKKYDNIDYKAVELAHKAQIETFDETCELIDNSELSNSKNIILSGGYFLNCLNNFKLVKKYPNINFFVDPIPHDAGTSLGVAVHTANYT